MWGLYLFFFTTVIGWLFVGGMPGIVVDGFMLYPMDLVSSSMFIAGLIRAIAILNINWLLRIKWIVIVGLLLLVSFLNGVFFYGIKSVGLDFRNFFYVYASILFVVCYWNVTGFEGDFWIVIRRIGVFLMCLALIRWMMVAFGVNYDSWSTSTKGPDHGYFRVLNAGQTLFLTQFSLVALISFRDFKNHYLSLLGLLMVMVLQHRTLWVVTAVVLVWAVVKNAKFDLCHIYRVIRWAAIAIVVILFAFYVFADLRMFIGKSVEEAFDPSSSTIIDRYEGWAELLSPSSFSAWQWIIGKPFGTPYIRLIMTHITEYSPHSHFVSWLLRSGFIGVFCWLMLWRQGFLRRSGNHWAKIVVITQIIFGITYSLPSEQGLVLGLAIIAGKGEQSDG
ncbi:MAG: hypothetical protein H6Q00_842 [Holophagaceae bacterium]|nr:hypothetical protein [Holophagaceae bacterium]